MMTVTLLSPYALKVLTWLNSVTCPGRSRAAMVRVTCWPLKSPLGAYSQYRVPVSSIRAQFDVVKFQDWRIFY